MAASERGEIHIRILWDESGFVIQTDSKAHPCPDRLEVQRVIGDMLDQLLPAGWRPLATDNDQMGGPWTPQ